MIKTIFHNVFSVSMALLVLFSTVSFTVEKHFCGDILIDASIFDSVEKCASGEVELIDDCCKDTLDVILGQDELSVKSFKELDLDQQVFIVCFADAYLSLFEGTPNLVVPHKNYSPPNLTTELRLLHQVFII
ncbi:HYC_CC_PP family protein [Bizionia sp. KMM 8389]